MSLSASARVSSDFSIHNIRLASGPVKGISFDDNIVRISKALCTNLARGDVKSILLTYSLVGRYGSEIPKTAVFNLSKTKDGPVISSHILREALSNEALSNNGAVCFDLLSDCPPSYYH